MRVLLGVLSVFAFFPMIITGMITYGYIKDRDYKASMKVGCIFTALLAFVILAPKGKQHSSGSDCFIEWDARSSRSVCD